MRELARLLLIICCMHLIGCSSTRGEITAPCDAESCPDRQAVNGWYHE